MHSAVSKTNPGSSRVLYGLFLAVAVLLVMLWRWNQSLPLPLFDLYPLYYGARAWLATGNAYDLSTIVPPGDQGFLVYRIGNGYPFPAILLALPLALLPAHLAATLWVGLLVGGVLVGLRLLRAPIWLLIYVPLLEGLRIEQYTVFVLVLQLFALWAHRERRLWLLALCCALILTKPSHGTLFVVVMALLARNWRQLIVAVIVVWGGPLLLDPGWPGEWLAAVRTYVDVAAQPQIWWMLPLGGVLLIWRDYISAAVVSQLALAPFPGVYAASALTLGVINERRTIWLSAISLLWAPVALYAGKPIATALTLTLPVVVLSLARAQRERGAAAAQSTAEPDTARF